MVLLRVGVPSLVLNESRSDLGDERVKRQAGRGDRSNRWIGRPSHPGRRVGMITGGGSQSYRAAYLGFSRCMMESNGTQGASLNPALLHDLKYGIQGL